MNKQEEVQLSLTLILEEVKVLFKALDLYVGMCEDDVEKYDNWVIAMAIREILINWRGNDDDKRTKY